MNLRVFAAAAFTVLCGRIFAGEGMWLLQDLDRVDALTESRGKGVLLDAGMLYSADSVSIKDGVVIFGRGCTGEVVSDRGLVFTNHHCGYEWIQSLSSVENDFLSDGFWAMSEEEELPCEGLEVRFISSIREVTDSVVTAVERSGKRSNLFNAGFLKKIACRLAYGDSTKTDGKFTEAVIKSFYGGNRFLLFTYDIYRDIRLVGTPPSSIGKFGYDTDNWMWPRHTGDFSIFRVYTDTLGNAAEYDKSNIPLKPKFFFDLSLNGVEEGDFTAILGFPGTTNRYDISDEIVQYRDIVNAARINMRQAKLSRMEELMLADPKTRIQYASKYSTSSNYWKNAIGMNRGIKRLKVIEEKRKAEDDFCKWAMENGRQGYAEALDSMRAALDSLYDIKYQYYMLYEGLRNGTEFANIPSADSLLFSLEKRGKKDSVTVKFLDEFASKYYKLADKDYDPYVDKEIAKVMLKAYMNCIPAEKRPDIFEYIEKKYKNDTDRFIEEAFKSSIFADVEKFAKFVNSPSAKVLKKDLLLRFSSSVRSKSNELSILMKPVTLALAEAKKEYIRGLLEMRGDSAVSFPDANFTIRASFGNVKAYSPADAVSYDYYTTLDGVMEKEDPDNYEFEVPEKLKEIHLSGDYGIYADKDGEMRLCFISDNDITGGNSGSPVINGNGEIVGLAFDGNWEAMSGDIIFEKELQRTICVDIRYVLMIIDKYAGADNLLRELKIKE